MSPEKALFGAALVGWLLAVAGWYYAIHFRREETKTQERAQYWFDAFNRAKGRSSLPAFSYPRDLIIGTNANPILLDRGGELDDMAVASTLADLVKDCGGRLTNPPAGECE